MSQSAPLPLMLSFSAGILSFLSPCVLPLIPSYLTFITGLSLENVQQSRRTALVHALLFVLGFSLIFVALGASATALGQLLTLHREWLTRIGGVLVLLFGIVLAGGFTIGGLAREHRIHLTDKPLGYLGTVLVGITFGAGWAPCIGPILASILAVAASAGTVGRGMLHLAAYSLGLGVPFVLAALAMRHFVDVLARFRTGLIWMSRASGVLLIVIGILLLTDGFSLIAARLQALTPAILRDRL